MLGLSFDLTAALNIYVAADSNLTTMCILNCDRAYLFDLLTEAFGHVTTASLVDLR